MNRTRCFFVGAALVTTNMLQPPTNAQAKTDKEPTRIELGGISLGDRVVMKGDANRKSKQRTLFSVFGTPTAVVLPSTDTRQNEVKGQSKTEGLPEWAQHVVTKVDKDHVLWLYRRSNHAMGFLVNREGIIDAITVARTK